MRANRPINAVGLLGLKLGRPILIKNLLNAGVTSRDVNETLHDETETRPRRSKKKRLETASRRSRPRLHPWYNRYIR
jgi:hypothetical protein